MQMCKEDLELDSVKVIAEFPLSALAYTIRRAINIRRCSYIKYPSENCVSGRTGVEHTGFEPMTSTMRM